ncbi:MAG: (d)CMP kinase, partial [Muribaculaceae bacterium]|nr:(d)CMP kinase [Muribaculaceae bacterium]
MADKKIIIAIDGFSSSGKSSMAKQLAKTIGYAYIDSGAMYRAVTLYAMRKGISTPESLDEARLVAELPNIEIGFVVDEQTGRSRTVLNGEDVEDIIRTIEVSNQVSPVSAVAEVRRDLVRKQQAFGLGKGIVMDGRDIGTTVFPTAEMKVFVDASPEVRAKRRHIELAEKGQEVSSILIEPFISVMNKVSVAVISVLEIISERGVSISCFIEDIIFRQAPPHSPR